MHLRIWIKYSENIFIQTILYIYILYCLYNFLSNNQHAIGNKIKGRGEAREHWLDRADDTYDNKLIEDIKATLRVLLLFVPLPVFWALYDQQGSQWTLQATRMNGEIGSFVILPDQLQAVNPLLIIIFIPIFEKYIYPAFAKIHFIDTPLKKLVVGGFLASLSFVAAGIVDLQLEVFEKFHFLLYGTHRYRWQRYSLTFQLRLLLIYSTSTYI